MYRIGEFSKIVKLTVKTLRFYEDAGLFSPARTDDFTGYRYYTTEQLYPLQRIVAFRQAGFSIGEIKLILSGKNVDELLERKEAELTDERARAEQRLRRLSTIRKFYSEEQTMDYQAVIKQLPGQTVFYKRFKAHDYNDFTTAIPGIGAAVARANPGLKCANPDYSYVEYLDGEYRDSDFNVEYAQAVEKAGVAADGIAFKELPPTEVACVMHKGPWQDIGKAFAYIVTWIKDNGYEIVGNYREQYIDGCWNKDSEDDYLTEVQIPVGKIS